MRLEGVIVVCADVQERMGIITMQTPSDLK